MIKTIISLTLLSCLALAEPMQITLDNGGKIAFTFTLNLIVNGQNLTFNLDTGAGVTTLAPTGAIAALPSVGSGSISGAAGVSENCDAVNIANIVLDGLKLTNKVVARCEIENSPTMNNLGINAFNGSVFSINFSKSELLAPSTLPSGLTPVPMQRTQEGHMILPVQIAGSSASALFDSGWIITAIDSKFIAAHPQDFTLFPVPAADSYVTDIDGNKIPVSYYMVKALQVGPLTFTNQFVMSYEFTSTFVAHFFAKNTIMVIGTNTMIAADWTFDLKKNVWAGSLNNFVNPLSQ